jgi:ABC-type Fe3+/spermidine/putrescine transport system ATPase subunit
LTDAIVTENLRKVYNSFVALDNLNLRVACGVCLGFLGPNGAGKTTTIKVLTALTNPTSGKAYLNGIDVTSDPKAALSDVGAVVETPEFYPYLTPKEMLSYLGELSADRSSMAIYIPPEFSFLEPDTTSIWTSITNDYNRISIMKLSSRDPVAPLWWRVTIANLTIPKGSHAVRMFNIKAPEMCGRYFLKVFIDGESIGSEDFPTVVVKGDIDPAYISGRVLYGKAKSQWSMS